MLALLTALVSGCTAGPGLTRAPDAPRRVDTPAETVLLPNEDGTAFGSSLAGAGDINGDGFGDFLISSTHHTLQNNRVYVYYGSADGVTPTASQILIGEALGLFGEAMDGAGDVNGDGYDDVVIGAGSLGQLRGGVYVYYGSSTGLSAEYSFIEGPQDDSRFGSAVSGAGDLDGDGFDDILVGAQFINRATGAAFLYYGSADGILSHTQVRLDGPAEVSWYGTAVAGDMDLNADGYPDIAVGTLGSAEGTYVYLGSAAGVPSTALQIPDPLSRSASFGRAVDGSGDLNGDGYDDLVISDYTRNAVYVFEGGPNGPSTTPSGTVQCADALARFGEHFGHAGDVNGDGYDDLVIGALYYLEGYGLFELYEGSSVGITGIPANSEVGLVQGDFLGSDVAGAGDVNGDGLMDLIVGAQGANDYNGRTYLYVGVIADLDGDGHRGDVDCDDGDPTIYPGAVELCDGLDNDCDAGTPDESGPEATLFYRDADGDGYGDPAQSATACEAPEGYFAGAGDCDDGAERVHPGAAETCGDGLDSDCDGAGGPEEDEDGDGLGNAEEAALGTDGCDADSDGDGLSDGEESDLGTDPLDPDTDGDGLLDGEDPHPLVPARPAQDTKRCGTAPGSGDLFAVALLALLCRRLSPRSRAPGAKARGIRPVRGPESA